MAKSKLMKISYHDKKEGIRLTTYADTIVYRDGPGKVKTLAAIRFGGYIEQVRGMSDAIYGGGSIEIETPSGAWGVNSLTKQYHRQMSNDGVYAEATLTAVDDEALAKSRDAEDEQADGQQKMDLPPRTYYIFCPVGDENRLFEEIDRKVSTPLIPEYKDYLLDALKTKGILVPLDVLSCSMKFDAWALTCSQDDKNIGKVLEDGLKSGAISIPGSENTDNSVFKRVGTVTQYLKEFGVTLAEKIKSRFLPLFDPASERLSPEILAVNANIKKNAGYPLYDAQLAAAEALKRKILQKQPSIIVAECGSGKTKIGATALYAAHAAEGKAKSFNIVMCPSHVTDKWVREIEETVPNSFGGVIRDISEFRMFHAAYEKDNRTAFAVISKEKARDGYMKAPSVFWNKRKQAFLCPRCYEPVEMELMEDGCKYRVLADANYFLNENSNNHKCESCDEVLWGALNPSCSYYGASSGVKPNPEKQNEWVRIGEYGYVHRKFARDHMKKRRVAKSVSLLKKIGEVIRRPKEFFAAKGAYRAFPLSTYIKHHMKGKIDGFIADELHQYAQDSGQGDAMAEVAAAADKVIGMTATLINGYSSGIFHLLWRLFSRYMVMDYQKYRDPMAFNREYGVIETVYETDKEEAYNSNRRASKRKVKERQLPGVSPLVYSRFLMEHAVFLSLMDMGKALPEYEEFPIPMKMREAVKEEYDRIQLTMKEVMLQKKIANKLLSAFINLLTVYPDQPYGHDPIMHPFEEGNTIISPKDTGVFEDKNQKELKVLEIVGKKVEKGESVLIYTSWVRIDTQEKLLKLLSEAGYKTAVLPNTVKPQKREKWVEDKVASGVQVLITNPSLVETGLDLNDFTTLIYYNIGYNLFTLRQSSRRSWRINQTAPRIEVYFFYYEDTIQERAINLMASKLAVAGILEGQITDEGLAAMSDCRDLTSQLAKELTLGIKSEVEDIAAVFKKMAFLKTDEEKEEFQRSKVVELPVPTPEPRFAEPAHSDVNAPVPVKKDFPAKTAVAAKPPVVITESFVFAVSKRGKKTAAAQVENQLSLFDQSA